MPAGAFLAGGEALPWDEWGRMTAAYEGVTGADYDELRVPAELSC